MAASSSSGDSVPLFCDAGSIKVNIASLIGQWTRRLLVEPPVDVLHERLKLQITDTLGMHMVTQCNIPPGELVLSERPLLRVPEISADIRRGVERRYGPKAAFMIPAVAVNWARVSDEEKDAALNLFWAHPLMSQTSNILMAESCDAVQDLIDWHPSLRGRWDVKVLMRFLHIVDLNIHKDDEEPGHASFSGIFVLGSKFTHGCSPNCSWSFNDDGCLQYRSIRAIVPGEVLTFSYIGNGMNLAMSTILRQHRLSTLWFCCRCSRCTNPDLCRQMRCPRCSGQNCVPVHDEQGSDLSADWFGDRPLRDLIHDATVWSCQTCNAICPSSEMPLFAEEELNRLVPQAMHWSVDTSAADVLKADQLRSRAAQTVGTMHWTWVLTTFAWLQKWLARLRAASVVEISDKRLQAGSAAIANWFRVCAPDCSEQRLSALFLSVRLASNLGGSIRDWGYEPEDPLGDDGASAKRLAEHGWRLVGDEVVGPDEASQVFQARSGKSSTAGRRIQLSTPAMYRSRWG
eukprot:TRINITY_DN67025_c0_g1_i1.p1 TRINITY_DN67025_c0_g1~~TRINITY_DN67025_c0_g1_i1.p1  ORF type:complete len:538 (-),score=76.95 TRINITY_DN67025_c0_g1_i1:99-1646(-)